MLTYLVDDRGESGEYVHFLRAHGDRLPEMQIEVLSSWGALVGRMAEERPDLVLLDMHFDQGEVAGLCGDLDALITSARFGNDRERAEAQLRRLQKIFILQTLRDNAFKGPVVLFGTLPQQQAERLLEQYGPLQIVAGLLYDGVRDALIWARSHVDVDTGNVPI